MWHVREAGWGCWSVRTPGVGPRDHLGGKGRASGAFAPTTRPCSQQAKHASTLYCKRAQALKRHMHRLTHPSHLNLTAQRTEVLLSPPVRIVLPTAGCSASTPTPHSLAPATAHGCRYGPRQGYRSFREALAAFLAARYGTAVAADSLLVTAGGRQSAVGGSGECTGCLSVAQVGSACCISRSVPAAPDKRAATPVASLSSLATWLLC